jgi:hypothetical protein
MRMKEGWVDSYLEAVLLQLIIFLEASIVGVLHDERNHLGHEFTKTETNRTTVYVYNKFEWIWRERS